MGRVQKEEDNPMLWAFLCSCSFSLFSSSFGKCHPNNQKHLHDLLIALQLDQQCLWFLFQKCSKLFKIVQMWVMLPQEQEMEENVLSHSSLFSSRNKEQGTGKQGPKGQEMKEKRNFSKENATKASKLHSSFPHSFRATCFWSNFKQFW